MEEGSFGTDRNAGDVPGGGRGGILISSSREKGPFLLPVVRKEKKIYVYCGQGYSSHGLQERRFPLFQFQGLSYWCNHMGRVRRGVNVGRTRTELLSTLSTSLYGRDLGPWVWSTTRSLTEFHGV